MSVLTTSLNSYKCPEFTFECPKLSDLSKEYMEQVTSPTKQLISLIIEYISSKDDRQNNFSRIDKKITEMEQILYEKAPGQRKRYP